MAIEDALEEITDFAVSQPWRGRSGARNFRLLCTVIRRIGLNGHRSLKITTDLPSLAFDAGLAYGSVIHDALAELADAGWLRWEIGDASYFVEDRNPSEIELLPQTSTGRFNVRQLPDPRLSLYAKDEGGSSAYLLIARVIKDGRASYSHKDLATLTGLGLRTVERKMKKLSYHFRKVDGRWRQDDLQSACEKDIYDYAKHEDRIEALEARREADKSRKSHDRWPVRGGFASPQPERG